jgi:glycosyltransferase involved in cell wall biosynthesis
MASLLDAELHEIISRQGPAFRYLSCSLKTTALVFKERPDILFVQSPSVVLAWLATTLLKPLCGRVIVDAHNCAVDFSETGSPIPRILGRQALSRADLVLVHNQYILAATPESARAIVVHDPLPNIPKSNHPVIEDSSQKKERIFIISSWAKDEPIETLIEAAKILEGEANFEFSGKIRSERLKGVRLPQNIDFLGFIPKDEFFARLGSATASIVLTTRSNCANCGAYESAALQVPMILADTPVLRHTFPRGALFTHLNAPDIAQAVRTAVMNKAILRDEVRDLREIICERARTAQQTLCHIFSNSIRT